MLNKLKKTDNKGFTIIEVMIVLAIAGLILLIVFLAVPALQRSQRNTSRKSDAGHISTAVNDFISNSGGVIPGGTTGATWAADCATIVNDAGTLNQYNSNNKFACQASTAVFTTSAELIPATELNAFLEVEGSVTTQKVTGQAMILDVESTCPASATYGQTITSVASASDNISQATIMYTTESSSGPWSWACLQIQ
jgi:prepilin-type N-terminal cleavage/methylation domain-containing protein